MPTLALQSKTVFHSLLAVSAACLCWDMISQEPPPSTSAVNSMLMAGYRHFNLASEKIRDLISQPDALKPEPLLAGATLLVPFASTSQQIQHWISSNSESQDSHKVLSSTPRDVIVLLRGIRTTIQAFECGEANPAFEVSQETELESDMPSLLRESNAGPADLPPSRTHVMFPMLAATSRGALSKLKDRLRSASLHKDDLSEEHSDDSLSACAAAFEVLDNLATQTFSAPNLPTPRSSSSIDKELLELESSSYPRVAPWLRSYVTRPAVPMPTEPLTRPFLSFLVQVPQSYLDLVLPLLDQRLESPASPPSGEMSAELTREQALALDIYAHWSVLMFLVEDESWWIGKLPVVTLSGMVNRYGDDFVANLWPECGHGQEQWWPGSMLKILREIKRYQ
jgi:hypothetical protein